MARPDCVFFFHCGNIAGPDGEHLFPSALGGLRGHKKILCKKCNERFGARVDRALASQLAPLGAFLGVKTDRGRRPLSVEVTHDATGQKLRMDGSGNFNRPAPVLVKKETFGAEQRMQYTVSSEAQMQELLKTLREDGGFKSVRVDSVNRERNPLTGTYTINGNFGGDSFRAVGKVALNHLARHFPDVARQPGLEPFKRYLIGETDDAHVWLDYRGDFSAVLPANAFEFGHRVILSLASDGFAWAHVDLFSVYLMAVRLGCVAIDESRIVAIDINPLAEREGEGIDVRTTSISGQSLPFLERSDDLDGLRTRIVSRMEAIVKTYHDRRWNSDAERTLSAICKAYRTEEDEPVERIAEILWSQQLPRIAQLPFAAIDGLRKPLNGAGPDGERLMRILQHIANMLDAQAQGTKASAAVRRDVFFAVAHAIATDLCGEMVGRELTAVRLRSYLEGAPGRRIALDVLMGIVGCMAPEYAFLCDVVQWASPKDE